MTPRVGFQGTFGAFSEEAVRRFFRSAEPVPFRDFREVGDAVAAGAVDFGLLPIENTIAGSVLPSYNVLARDGFEVVGEVVTPIHHYLLGVPGSSIGELRRVHSHAVALAQCQRFLAARPSLEAVAVYDTAGAAEAVAAAGDLRTAAIAGRLAGERYNLAILAERIEDRPDNQTRFLVVCRHGAPRPAPERPNVGPSRTMLLVDTANEPGALVRVLLPFAEAEINLSKLESRPGPEPWTSRFFIELDAPAADEGRISNAVAVARRSASGLRVLGTYSRWSPDE